MHITNVCKVFMAALLPHTKIFIQELIQLTQTVFEITQILELLVKNFKLSIIDMVMDLMEKVDSMHK